MNAPFGQFGMAALRASTRALSADDATYTALETEIANLTTERDAVAADIRSALHAAEFSGDALDERQAKAWIAESESLIQRAEVLAR
jgi:hypothetical protein